MNSYTYGTHGYADQSGYILHMNLNCTSSISSNQTQVYASIYLSSTSGSGGSVHGTFKITLNGKTQSATKTVTWSGHSSDTVLNSSTYTYSHTSLGKGPTVSLSASASVSGSFTSASTSASFTLKDIPQTTTVVTFTSQGFFDSTHKYSYLPKTSGLYHRAIFSLVKDEAVTEVLSVDLGSKQSGVQEETQTFDETVLADIYGQITDASSGTLRLALRCYEKSDYTSLVGSSSRDMELSIPDNESTKPIASLQITPVSSLPSPFDTLYVQRKSGLLADVINAEGKYGASIVSKEVVVLGAKGGAPFAVERLSASGDLEIKGTVTDSRGFKRTVTETVYVIPYSAPRILPAIAEDEVIVARCDAEGVLDDSGKYLKIKAKREYSKLEADGVQNNFCRIRYRYKTEGGEFSAWSLILASDSVSDEVDTGALLDGGLLLDHSYIVQVQAIDTLGETGSTSVSVPTELVYLHKCGSRRSLGIGKYAEDSNTVDVAEDLTVKIRGEVEFLFEKWTSLGLSASVTASSESVGRLGGSDCAYLVRAGGRHIFVAFNCSFSGPVTINETQIPEEYRPSADIYGICPLAEHGYAIIRVGTDGFVSVVNITGPVNIDWIDGYIDYWI